MSWIEPGTYTWTCPAEVYRVRVALCAGGGGQLCCDSLSSRNGLQLPKGEKSTFGELITAFAGNSGSVTKYKYHQGDHTRYGYHITGMTDGSPIFTDKPIETNLGGAKYYTQAYGWECSFDQKQVLYGFGSGGEKYELRNVFGNYFHLGASGGYNTGYVDVVPYKTYQIVVGNNGNTLEYNRSANPNGSIGGDSYVLRPSKSGFVLIAFGGDI